jgi:PAS domain S-box-containing protein
VARSDSSPARAGFDPALDLTVFRRMADLSNDAFYLCDIHGRFLYVNQRSIALSGYSHEEMLQMAVPDINPEFPAERFAEFVAGMPTGSFLPPFETKSRTKDGTVFPIEISVARLARSDGEFLFGVVRDIRERKELELARKRFARRMLETLEAERERVARELQDDVGAAVTNVGRVLAALEQRPGALGEEARPTLAAIRTTLAQIDESTRRVVGDYRPADLVGRSLEETVRTHVRQFAERHGLDVRLATVPLEGLLSPDHELHVYRIIQEAITNVARHARARRVTVQMERNDDQLTIAVRDDGVGFPAAQATGTGFGLVTMRERAALMGAALRLDSEPGRTEVALTVPLPAASGMPPGAGTGP